MCCYARHKYENTSTKIQNDYEQYHMHQLAIGGGCGKGVLAADGKGLERWAGETFFGNNKILRIC